MINWNDVSAGAIVVELSSGDLHKMILEADGEVWLRCLKLDQLKVLDWHDAAYDYMVLEQGDGGIYCDEVAVTGSHQTRRARRYAQLRARVAIASAVLPGSAIRSRRNAGRK